LDPGGWVVPSDPTGLTPSGGVLADNISLVVGQPENFGTLKAEFLDLSARMSRDTAAGPLTFSPQVTVVLKYDFPANDVTGFEGLCPPPERICSGLGRNVSGRAGFAGVSAMPRWQASFPVGLRFGGHNVRATIQYRDELTTDVADLTPDQAATFERADGQWTTSLNWSWQITGGTSLSANVNKLFDEDPPEGGGGGGGARFRRLGRTYGLVFRHSFDN
jgi:hypothetical protein